MYRVNQQPVRLVQMMGLLGFPLLVSFLLQQWAWWQIPSVAMVGIAIYLNNLYPDRIGFADKQVQIKCFLFPEQQVYPTEQVQYRREERWITLYIQGKARYRILVKGLSVRCLRQLQDNLERYV